jgi:hypothetical protein
MPVAEPPARDREHRDAHDQERRMLSPHEDEHAADQTDNGPDCDLPDGLQDRLA